MTYMLRSLRTVFWELGCETVLIFHQKPRIPILIYPSMKPHFLRYNVPDLYDLRGGVPEAKREILSIPNVSTTYVRAVEDDVPREQ